MYIFVKEQKVWSVVFEAATLLIFDDMRLNILL